MCQIDERTFRGEYNSIFLLAAAGLMAIEGAARVEWRDTRGRTKAVARGLIVVNWGWRGDAADAQFRTLLTRRCESIRCSAQSCDKKEIDQHDDSQVMKILK